MRRTARTRTEGGLLTLASWADLDEDEPGELIDGRLEEEEMPTNLHELVVAWLLTELSLWARKHGAQVYGSEHKLAIAPRRGRKADVAVYLPGASRPDPAESISHVAPGLVVEVLSPRPRDQRRDRIDKARDYARLGVRWYWLLDPAVRLLEILELGADGRYVRAREAAEGRVRIPGCRGLVLDLDALWSHATGEPPPRRRAPRGKARAARS